MGTLDRFRPLHYLQCRQEGLPLGMGWKTRLYSSLYSNMAPSLTTPSPPCDGIDWGSVFGFGFSLDGSLLAAACEKKSLLIYDPMNMKLLLRKTDVHSDCVNCVRFLDNRIFATCSDDHTVCLWDMRNLRKEFKVLRGHTSWVKNIEYAPSTGKLVTSGFDGNIFTWDINNYSENTEIAEPVLHISGIMRTVLTPAGDKMIISTLGGYFILVHNLNLNTLKEDMQGFKPHLMRIMQVLKVPLSSVANQEIFTRDRNRVEYMGDFPPEDSAESISTMEVHPHGWCVASRNTTPEEDSEWTCIHDIQACNSHKSNTPTKSPRSSQPSSSHSATLSPANEFLSMLTSLPVCESSDSHSGYPLEEEEEDSDTSSSEEDEELASTLQNNGSEEDQVEEDDEDTEDESQASQHQTESQSALSAPSSSSASSQSHLLRQNLSTSGQLRVFHQGPWSLPLSLGAHHPSIPYLTHTPFPAPYLPPYRHPLGSLRPRLLFHLAEPNVGLGFIKEQSFSPEGRVLASPYRDCVRLLAFDQSCTELCDCVPAEPRPLVQVGQTGAHKTTVLSSMFSPTQLLLVSGAKDGTIMFSSPKL